MMIEDKMSRESKVVSRESEIKYSVFFYKMAGYHALLTGKTERMNNEIIPF